MTPKLRNRHLAIWIGLALLLPLLGAVILFQLPADSFASGDISGGVLIDLPHTLEEHNSEEFILRLKSLAPGEPQYLELDIQQALQQPAAWVYVSGQKDSGVENSYLLGHIGSRGTYQFPLDSAAIQWKPLIVTIYDGIHQQITHQIEL